MRENIMRCCWWLALLIVWSAQGATLNVTAEYNPATYEVGGLSSSIPPPVLSSQMPQAFGAVPLLPWRLPKPYDSIPKSVER